jgi:hypothetical protein
MVLSLELGFLRVRDVLVGGMANSAVERPRRNEKVEMKRSK